MAMMNVQLYRVVGGRVVVVARSRKEARAVAGQPPPRGLRRLPPREVARFERVGGPVIVAAHAA